MAKEHRHALPKGFELDGYRIKSMLGAGGFGITYLAEQTSIGRKVPIKEYLPAGIAARATGGLLAHLLSFLFTVADADQPVEQFLVLL
ncbi:MAG: hypothetical protein O7I42_23070 [Alphaproteobacteria bacterium]|nr:hypothetical protein [Alphaproteobacteria bacterium]